MTSLRAKLISIRFKLEIFYVFFFLFYSILEDGAFAFRGLPYAVPPLEERRWLKAEPLNNISYCWDEILLAHNSTPTCLQIHSNGSTSGVENCLTLDVVTPFVR